MRNFEQEERCAYIKFICKLLNGMSICKLRDTLEAVLKIYDG